MRKIAIVSDIHGNILALEKVVADIETRQVDCVFNLGDHISGPLYPKETLQFLMKQDWVHILGNHDRQLISQNPQQHGLSDSYAFSFLNDSDLDWLRTLPASTMVDKQFFLFHGTPSSDTTYLLETVQHGRARLVTQAEIAQRLDGAMSQIMLCGHTHIPRVVGMAQDMLVVNPGSVGLPAYDDVTPEYHVMETGSQHARYAILEYKNCTWQAELITVSYDAQQAAQQARKNGRPDWEYALQTGFMPQQKAS
jgi:putative phosphoesterase